MELIELQFLFMGLIFASTSFCGLAPILFGKYFKKKLALSSETAGRLLSDASCFGAGVFLFVCFLGLLPEADKKFHAILKEVEQSEKFSPTFVNFPWGFFTVTIGFLIIFSIDKFVHALHESKKQSSSEVAPVLTVGQFLEQPSEIHSLIPLTNDVQKDSLQTKPALNYECHVEVCGIADEDQNHGVPSSMIFLVALGIHSVFEGIAVGLQKSKERTTEFSIAVLVHEVIMAFTFGLEVSKSKYLSRRTKIMYIFIFTSSIPVGIAIGLVLQNSSSEHQQLISAIIEAFATGIFLHVIFIEILGNEFSHDHIDRHKCLLISAPEARSIEKSSNNSSRPLRILEKIFCICIGFTSLILMNVFMVGHITHD